MANAVFSKFCNVLELCNDMIMPLKFSAVLTVFYPASDDTEPPDPLCDQQEERSSWWQAKPRVRTLISRPTIMTATCPEEIAFCPIFPIFRGRGRPRSPMIRQMGEFHPIPGTHGPNLRNHKVYPRVYPLDRPKRESMLRADCPMANFRTRVLVRQRRSGSEVERGDRSCYRPSLNWQRILSLTLGCAIRHHVTFVRYHFSQLKWMEQEKDKKQNIILWRHDEIWKKSQRKHFYDSFHDQVYSRNISEHGYRAREIFWTLNWCLDSFRPEQIRASGVARTKRTK